LRAVLYGRFAFWASDFFVVYGRDIDTVQNISKPTRGFAEGYLNSQWKNPQKMSKGMNSPFLSLPARFSSLH
jgi:hypothetical protein